MTVICFVKCKNKTKTNNEKIITTSKNRTALTGTCDVCGNKKFMFMKSSEASSIDIHKWIGKILRPSKDWKTPGYKYLGPYNPLEKQVSGNKKDW